MYNTQSFQVCVDFIKISNQRKYLYKYKVKGINDLIKKSSGKANIDIE